MRQTNSFPYDPSLPVALEKQNSYFLPFNNLQSPLVILVILVQSKESQYTSKCLLLQTCKCLTFKVI